MIKKLLAVIAISLTALTMLPPDPAEAQRGARGGGNFRAAGMRGGGFRGPAVRARVIGVRPVFVRRPVRIYRPIGIVRTRPVFIAGVGGCEWLRRRALVTGSPYWWSRYRRRYRYRRPR